jgi:hypothetical protein
VLDLCLADWHNNRAEQNEQRNFLIHRSSFRSKVQPKLLRDSEADVTTHGHERCSV